MLSCEAYCKNLGMVSNNSENKAKFIKDGLSKESLDDILQSQHPNGYMQREIHNL